MFLINLIVKDVLETIDGVVNDIRESELYQVFSV